MNQPVTFTDAAVGHIKNMIKPNQPSAGFRLSVKKTGCTGFAYLPAIVEEMQPNDLHYIVQDDLQIYVDPAALTFFDELKIDFVEETSNVLKQKRLVFINPKETGRCGCGESFTVE
jgi:iron-sulfur cluster assembly accessory protein